MVLTISFELDSSLVTAITNTTFLLFNSTKIILIILFNNGVVHALLVYEWLVVCALLWHLGVNRGIATNPTNPLSASHFTDMVHDSIQFSDHDSDDDDDFDDNIRYSLFNRPTDRSSDDDSA